MKDAIMFWLAKHLVDLLLPLPFIAAIALMSLPRMIRQSRCPHDGDVNETGACDAICRECGKNLGFIGTWRQKLKDGRKCSP